MVIVTAGQAYNDIDALACAIAYSELLTLKGISSNAVLSGALNNSVTNLVKQIPFSYRATYSLDNEDTFVLVDISNPDFISKFVDTERITEVFDHHYGFEEFWKEKLGNNARIEMIGACATLIYEEFVKENLLHKISNISANLLSIAIVSNTLNFNISITHERDRKALKDLRIYSNLPQNWIEQYFSEQDINTYKDPRVVIKNDTKFENIAGLDRPLVIAQLELWDGQEFLTQHLETLQSVMKQFTNPYWVVTIPSISERKNYIFCESSALQRILENSLGIIFRNNIAETSELMLRKQILKSIHTR